MDEIDQRQAGFSRLNGPVAQGGPADFHPQPGKNLLLPVKREVIDKLAGQHMGQKAGAGDQFGDDLGNNRRDPHGRPVVFHAFAGPARVFGPDVTQHLDLGRDNVKLLAHLFADPA